MKLIIDISKNLYSACQTMKDDQDELMVAVAEGILLDEGEWEHDESDNSVTCKKCGCSLYPNDISNGEAHFCPNCGADMRGKADETD